MKRCFRVLAVLVMLSIMTSVAYGLQPVYEGQYGNPEEPALRPYKWMWRGLKAFVYQPARAFKEGNLRAPFLGTCQTFRGVRKGMVEFDESIFRGAMFSVPPQAGNPKHGYKRTLRANEIIDSDPVLRNTADFLATTTVTSIASGATSLSPTSTSFSKNFTGPAWAWKSELDAAGLALINFAAQKVVDHKPINDEAERNAIIAKHAENKQRKEMDRRAKIDLSESAVTRAQRSYVGHRIRIGHKIKGGGNLLKLGR